jgi:hypothetical protein
LIGDELMSKRAKVAAAVAAVVVASGLALYLLPSGHHTAHPVPAAAPVVHAPLAVKPVVQVARPARPALPHEAVGPAAPNSFEMSGAAFDIKAVVCQMPYIRPLDPPGDQLHTVCWVRDQFGVAPGSNSGGTSYILGHAWAEQRLVLNPLSEFAMRQVTGRNAVMQSGVPTYPVTNMNGYKIVLRTPRGTLAYTVTRAFAVAKEQAANVASLMANTPNRVVVITCGVSHGVDTDYNIIVDAYLQSSVAA